MKRLHFGLITFLVFSLFSCSSLNTKRSPSSDGLVLENRPIDVVQAVVPTKEQLFLSGKFTLEKKRFHEDHYGEQLDLSVRRPVVDLAGTIFEKKYGAPGSHLIANFYHKGSFYIARINKQAIENIYFEIAYFPPVIMKKYLAAHNFLRLETKADTPVELVAPMPDIDLLELLRRSDEEDALALLPIINIIPIKNFGVTSEAQWVVDDEKKAYSLLRGKKGAFIQIIRFVAFEERLKGFFKNGYKIRQFKIDKSEIADRIVDVSIKKSQKDGIGELYDTIKYNCSTQAFDIIEEALEIKDKRFGFIRKYLQKSLAAFSGPKVESYGATEVEIAHKDITVIEELRSSYDKIVVEAGRDLCPEKMGKESCNNLTEAEKFIKENQD
jgi:hypothetical protein